jgi:membrane protease subunit HflK
MSHNEDGSDNEPTPGPWGKGTGSGKKPEEGNTPNPWGQDRRRPRGPFNDPAANKKLEDSLEALQRRLRDIFGKGGGDGSQPSDRMPNKKMIMGIGTVAIALWFSTGFFRVQENELAVVMRFGKMVRVVSAGLQYHLPYPIESVLIQNATVNVISSAQKIDKNSDTEPTLILTGDENMVHCNYTVRWKINNISDFLFMARKPDSTIRAATESVTREVIGQTNARSVLTEKRDEIEGQAQALLQKLMDQYKLGVEIVAFQLMDVAPPREVIDSYNDVQASLVDAEQDINKAESYRNDILPRARGSAFKIIQDSEGERDAKVAKAEGEVSRITKVYEAYTKNKSIAITRLYQDVMQEILLQTNKVIFDPKVPGVFPYSLLNKTEKPVEKTEEHK